MICDLVGGGTRGLNIVQLGKEHGEEHGGDEEKTGRQQCDAEVAYFGEEAKKYSADGGGDSANVVAEARARGAKQYGEKRRGGRSGEGRVGEEGRFRGGADHYKKKKE